MLKFINALSMYFLCCCVCEICYILIPHKYIFRHTYVYYMNNLR